MSRSSVRSPGAHVLAALLLWGPTTLPGCASSAVAPRPPAQASSPPSSVPRSRPPGERPPAPPREGVEIPPEASPEDYVRIALARNPGLRRAELAVERLRARVPQVTSFDDPMLELVPVGEMAETAAGQVRLRTSVRQEFPFFGKRAARGRVARQDVAIALQRLEETRLRVVRDVRAAYWSLYEATRALEVVRADRELLARFQRIAETKFAAGTATQQDVLRASVELSDVENELITLRQRRSTAAAMLNSLLDRPITAPVPPPPEVASEGVPLELEDLLARAVATNPSLQRIRERIGGYEERLEVARLERWPDLTVGFGYGAVDDGGIAPSADGTDQWWIGFGIDLPIQLGRREAAEREARRGIFEGEADLEDARNRIEFRVQDAFVRIDTQERLVRLVRDVILPRTRQTVEASESGYRAGSIDYLTLVDNWRKLLEFELLLHRSVARLGEGLADLQELVGDLQHEPR